MVRKIDGACQVSGWRAGVDLGDIMIAPNTINEFGNIMMRCSGLGTDTFFAPVAAVNLPLALHYEISISQRN